MSLNHPHTIHTNGDALVLLAWVQRGREANPVVGVSSETGRAHGTAL
jgi:hypothetical protein